MSDSPLFSSQLTFIPSSFSSHLTNSSLLLPFICPPLLLPSQCVVNLISELQEQMCRFQEEISTRIQEKRALEEREAQQGEPRGSRARGHSPRVGSAGSDLSLSGSDARRNNGGQTVHVGRLDGWTHLPLLPHHFFFSSPLLTSPHTTRYLDISTESN